jgi:hypothetical protein
MLSPDPPIVLGLAGAGRIVPAALADLVLLAPDLGVRLTLVAGDCCGGRTGPMAATLWPWPSPLGCPRA